MLERKSIVSVIAGCCDSAGGGGGGGGGGDGDGDRGASGACGGSSSRIRLSLKLVASFVCGGAGIASCCSSTSCISGDSETNAADPLVFDSSPTVVAAAVCRAGAICSSCFTACSPSEIFSSVSLSCETRIVLLGFRFRRVRDPLESTESSLEVTFAGESLVETLLQEFSVAVVTTVVRSVPHLGGRQVVLAFVAAAGVDDVVVLVVVSGSVALSI